jgi:diaminopimelate decarboxylase
MGDKAMKETVFISGLYSGPSPSAGLGVARSLRSAFPTARLVGVDYWAGSSGLHHEVFDATWLMPPWDLIEEDLYAKEVQAELDQAALWVPTLDLEVAWLARTLAPHPLLLAPDEKALAPIRKPRPSVTELLPFEIAPSLDLTASDEEIYSFCRAHSWRVWIKGPYHEAVAVGDWRQLEQVRTWMRERWQTDRLSAQVHVRGYEESVCLAAYDGRLCDALYMRKRITTPEGKTWAGHVGELPSDLVAPIEAGVRAICWTGGAEIELLRDVDGRLWWLEWNPRFPAWVHGATLAGRNLPAALVRRALGLPDGPRMLSAQPEFTRVVLEVPVRSGIPLPLPAEPEHGQLGIHGKYGASLSAIVPMLVPDEVPGFAPPTLSPETEADLRATAAVVATPHRLFLPRTAETGFGQLPMVAPADGIALRYAYSLKTSPDVEYLMLARKAGMLAECISLLEVRRALEAGWRPDEIVLNGPGKWWPPTERAVDGLRVVFCDSVEELERLAGSGRRDQLWGVRLRIPGSRSRFGVPVDEPADFERLCAAVAALPPDRDFGIHVHMASTMIGVGHWRDIAESSVAWAGAIEAASGRRVRAIDFGGGYHPDDFARLPFQEIVRFARGKLASLAEVYVEPGRALTQATMAMVTSVLDVRRHDGKLQEVVMDACIAELPLASVYPHRFFHVVDDRLVPVARGPVRVLGRICMEDDVLSQGLDLPDTLKIGDRLVICDAGAYERSMSYAFGRGGYP